MAADVLETTTERLIGRFETIDQLVKKSLTKTLITGP
jgi:hypothetical protein